ncbi:MAG: zinc ribbon domain-containing protein [Acidobacteria bacterium]|nr:zinc ribbon domain-containing protein [Acidobacteriota bacterium]
MNSEISTESTFRPWHFFVLAGLAAGTAGILVTKVTVPAALILLTLTIAASATVGLAVFRTLLPFAAEGALDLGEPLGRRRRAALEREKTLVLRSIKELEFDRAMGKIAETDFHEMAARLRARAVGLMKQLDDDSTGYREVIERDVKARLPAEVRLKPDTTGEVRLKPDATGEVRLKPDATGEVRLPPSPATRASASLGGGGVKRAAPSTMDTGALDTHTVGASGMNGGDTRTAVDAGQPCRACGTANDTDARFCKECGTHLGA